EMGSAYRQKPLAFRNLRNGRFEEWPLFSQPLAGRGAAVGDFDNDGDLDILINNMDDRPSLYENTGHPPGNWLTVVLDGNSNGARITVRTAGITQMREIRCCSGYLSSSDRRANFGLGAAESADVEVVWPNGKRTNAAGVKARQFLLLRQTQ